MPAWTHPDWTQQRRLVLAFVVALGLHLLILGLIKLPVARIATPAPTMVLQWVTLPARKPRAQPVVQTNKPARPVTRQGRDAPIHRENKAAEESVTPTTVLQPKTESAAPVCLNPADLGATVRSLARELAHEQGVVAPAQPENPADRSILPQLDQALGKPRPGVQRYESGLIKIVTAGGRVYCIQEQPNVARGGPVEPLSVPTTCP